MTDQPPLAPPGPSPDGPGYQPQPPVAAPQPPVPAASPPAASAYPSYPYAMAPAQVTRQVSPLPTEPVEYQHLLRGPFRAWWKPPVALVAALAIALLGIIVVSVAMLVLLVLSEGGADEGLERALEDITHPVVFAGQNVLLAMLIPAALFSTWLVHRVRPGYVSSVAGRIRWRWLGWCVAVVLPIWLAYVGLGYLSDPEMLSVAGDRPEHWIVLLVLMFLTTPFQAAAEEYLFRGWLMQQLGAWFGHRYVALGLAALLSALLFALAHGSLHLWIFLDLMVFALAAVILTWRTGGLEAAIVLHVVNNLLAIGVVVVAGGLEDAFITPETTGSPVQLLWSVISMTVVTTALLLVARWRGISRTLEVTPAA